MDNLIKKEEVMKKFLFAPALGISLTACMSTLPQHQLQSPASLGKGGLSASVLGYLYFPADKPDSPPAFSYVAGAGAAYGVTEKLDIEAEVLPEWQFNLGAKYQWRGSSLYKTKRGEWNSAVRSNISFTYKEKQAAPARPIETKGLLEEPAKTIAAFAALPVKAAIAGIIEGTIKGLDNWFGGGQKGIGFSAANSWGYMVRDWAAVYGGGQVMYQYMMFDFPHGGKYKFHLFGARPFVGIQLHTTGPKHRVFWSGEGGVMGVQSLQGTKKAAAIVPGVSTSLGWLSSF